MALGFLYGAGGSGKKIPNIELTYENTAAESSPAVTTDNSITFNQAYLSTYTQGRTINLFSFICSRNVNLTFQNILESNSGTYCDRYEIVDINTGSVIATSYGDSTHALSAGSYTVNLKHIVDYSFHATANTIIVI